MIRTLPFALLLLSCGPTPPTPVVATKKGPTIIVRDDLANLYDSLQLQGSFIMHDAGKDSWTLIDSAQADVPTLPASTFKIFGSLIGVESGVLSGPDHVFTWDGIDRGRVEVNKNLTLREAYRVSAYWYFQRLAQQLGPDQLKHWLDTVGYGNADTTGGYDQCWVAGGLRITPRQQVEFLERVQRGDVPFSTRTLDLVKGIMVQGDTLGYVLRGKTGWAMNDEGSIGWYVGWVEKADGSGPYFFVNRIRTTDTLSTTFAAARKDLAMEFMARLGAIPKR